MRTRAGVILKAAMYRQPAAEPERRPAMCPRRETAIAPRPGTPPGPRPVAAPVEYAVAVDRYLADATLGEASRRVYRISLTGWAWDLVGQRAPRRTGRRGAATARAALAAGRRGGGAQADRGAGRPGGAGRPADGQPGTVRAAQRGRLVAGPGVDQRGSDRRAAAPARPGGTGARADRRPDRRSVPGAGHAARARVLAAALRLRRARG